jgi:hypothetical protein
MNHGEGGLRKKADKITVKIKPESILTIVGKNKKWNIHLITFIK